MVDDELAASRQLISMRPKPHQVKNHEIYPGVSPIGDSEVVYHNYYQWVPYLLFLQSCTFFAPLVLHRLCQDGRVQRVVQDLNNIIVFKETRDDYVGDIEFWLRDYYRHQNSWAYKVTKLVG